MSIEMYNSTADDFAAAEGLLKRALELEQNDAEIWAISSLFNTSMRTRGFDHAPARRELARRDAERAVKLAPDSINALFALGRTQRDSEPELAEQTFKKILKLNPDHGEALSQLAWIYDRDGRVDEAAAIYERDLVLEPTKAALIRYLQFLLFFHYSRFEEAERCVRDSVAREPSANSLGGLAMVLLTAKGDAEEAARVLASHPDLTGGSPRTVWMAANVQLARRAPDEVLKGLDRLTDEYIQDNWFAGPKGYFAGRAHAMAGRKEAARVAWESGLAIVDARLKGSATSVQLHLMRGQLLAFLGREAEALQEARTVAEIAPGSSQTDQYWPNSPMLIYAALGRADDALPYIEKFLTVEPKVNAGWPLTPALLRLDPLWDRIRGDLRFQKLLIAHTPPRDWPKNPELKRAMGMLDRLDNIPEDFRLAEEIAQRAVDKDPTDPEAVSALARVHSMWLLRGWDRSTARYQKAKATAERALQLAPNEPEAHLALAIQLYARGTELQRAFDLAQRAVDLCPQEARFHRMRDNCLWVLSVAPGSVFSESSPEPENEGLRKALGSVRRTIELFPQDALARYELSRHYRDTGRWADFEKTNDDALALAPVANALVWKARAQFGLHGNLPGMKAVLDQVPARVRGIERTVYGYFLYAAFTGDTAVGLEALNSMTDSWMIDFDYRGPKTLLAGALLELAGKKELARVVYAGALDELMRGRSLNPEDSQTYLNEAWIKHALGRDDEARAALHIFNETLTHPFIVSPLNTWWFQPIPANLLLGERATALALIREAIATFSESRTTIRQRLDLDPRLAAFRNDPDITALLGGSTAAAAAPAVSEWPKDPDLKRAMKLIDSPEAIASDVILAEDIIKTVLAARPTDVEATLAMGRVQVYYLVRGFDRSEDRFAAAKRYAERAMALSPDDPEAMSVMATYLYRRGVELPRAAKLLRAAIAARPTNPFYYRMLDNVLSITPGISDAEVIASAKVTAERFPQDALVQYELARHYRDAGMLAEAEHYFDAAIQLGPVANAIAARARLMLTAHGDPAGMKALLDQLPERYRGTDRAVYSQFIYAMATQQPKVGLDALQAVPEAWMIDFDYTGPVSLLAGELLLLEGKPEMAKIRFTEALAELGRHKADLSRNFSTTWLETWLIMRLGRLDEARQRNEIFFPEMTRPFRLYLGTNWWFNPITQNLLLGERAKAVALMRDAVGFPEGRTVLRNGLGLDPRMKPFRDDPEIKAILAEPEGKK
ncbi:MAG TPA: tetratricopeptide repeat protein [Lacunisphaera sp.]